MNVRTPRGLAILAALVITILGMALCFGVLWLYGVQAPIQAYALGAVGLFALSITIIYGVIERFIYQKSASSTRTSTGSRAPRAGPRTCR